MGEFISGEKKQKKRNFGVLNVKANIWLNRVP